MQCVLSLATLCCAIAALTDADCRAAVASQELVSFPDPWTSPFRVDPDYPFQLVNSEGRHLFILNKTAWLYFGCKDPEGVLERAAGQGVNVIRVSLEGQYYYETAGIELWPWGGTRNAPLWSQFNEAYWDEVERRIRMAGERGIGFDVTLYCTLRPSAAQIDAQRPYWAYTIERLGKYANILTWEIANEYLGNEAFQQAVAEYFHEHDPYDRPVCTSDGTTDDAAWPDRPWIDLAINHTCTGSSDRHDLRNWYMALARNTRSHGKPAWCNESGRENRHGNNDGIHRRKQGWLWCTAGCFWTQHSWDGCEGIDEADYRAPGEEFLRPMADHFRALPFWKMNPNYTALTIDEPDLVWAALAQPDRSTVVLYVCTRTTGQAVGAIPADLRLPRAGYRITFQRPADLTILRTMDYQSNGSAGRIMLPPFTDDLVATIRTGQGAR